MGKKLRVVAIIQARMSSTRLPGKVLKDLCGKPMLWHIVRRLKECNHLNDIVVATSINASDGKIVEFAKRYKIKVFRGSEDDVLKRYIYAAKKHKADYVVRVTGDAPLIEPSEIDRLIKTAKSHKADFVMGYPDIPSIHEGFSVVSLKTLEKIYNLPNFKNYHKEHVTIYLKEHPEFVRTFYFKPRKMFQKDGYRLSVDNTADFKFMEEIYKKLWDGKNIVDLKKVIRFLGRNSELKSINAHVHQKKPKEKSKKIAFIIEGGERLGFGHFTRTTQIAKYLVENKNCGVIFLVNNIILHKKIKQSGFKSYFMKGKELSKINPNRIFHITNRENSKDIVIDVKSNHNPSNIIKFLKKDLKDIKITLIENATNARLLADKNIYPGVDTSVKNLNWKDYKGKIYSGIKYFPLRQDFVKAKGTNKEKNYIVITMGASDPNNITPFVMKALLGTDKNVKVIIGPAFKCKKQVKSIAFKHNNIFKLYESPNNYAQVIASSSLVITALGISIYEISYLGIPLVVIGNYKADLKVGKRLEGLSCCKYIGYYKDIKKEVLQEIVLSSPNKYLRPTEIPDRGNTKRIATVILN